MSLEDIGKESKIPDDFPVGRIRLTDFLAPVCPGRPKDLIPYSKERKKWRELLKKNLKKQAAASKKAKTPETEEDMKGLLIRGLGDAMIGLAAAGLTAKGLISARRFMWRRMTPEARLAVLKRSLSRRVEMVNPFAKMSSYFSKVGVALSPQDIHGRGGQSLGRGEAIEPPAGLLPWVLARKRVNAEKLDPPFLTHVEP